MRFNRCVGRSPDIDRGLIAALLSHRRNAPTQETKSQRRQENSNEHQQQPPLRPLLRPAGRLGRNHRRRRPRHGGYGQCGHPSRFRSQAGHRGRPGGQGAPGAFCDAGLAWPPRRVARREPAAGLPPLIPSSHWGPSRMGRASVISASGIEEDMQIAIIGPGGIGRTFAFRLSRAGHDVTVIARGRRLEQLRGDGAIVTADGQRAGIRVAAVLDESMPYDLVLVTVLASQVDTLLPTLARSGAASVMFMFNTFQSLDRLRDGVGAHRFAFGFPAIVASVADGTLSFSILRRRMSTTVTDPFWAEIFS